MWGMMKEMKEMMKESGGKVVHVECVNACQGLGVLYYAQTISHGWRHIKNIKEPFFFSHFLFFPHFFCRTSQLQIFTFTLLPGTILGFEHSDHLPSWDTLLPPHLLLYLLYHMRLLPISPFHISLLIAA